MGRKKTKPIEEEYTSTVTNIRRDFDWGKILFNACYLFNHNLALHWLNYVDNYNNGKNIKTSSQAEADILIQKRNEILQEKQRLKENVKNYSSNALNSYRQYAKILPIGKMVTQWRNNNLIDEYNNIIEARKEFYNKYNSFQDLLNLASIEEENYKNEHLFETRNFSNKARTLNKLIELHNLELHHPIQQDRQIIYDFLESEEQAERLMGVCLNILNTYSQKEFSTMMNIKDRENIADGIYDFFYSFTHNYDFIAGCYELKEDNKLHLKDIETLHNKFYNGYYFTIRGFVQRSYVAIRKEHFNITSADMNWENDEGNGNHGVDNFANTESINNKSGYSTIIAGAERYKFGEGMIAFWTQCQDYLQKHVEEMAKELFDKMNKKFSHMPYYSNMTNTVIMQQVIMNVISGINNELIKGRYIGNKLKHIILDSMGGAESKEEWKSCSNFIVEIMTKYINNFFVVNNKYLNGEKYENV